MNSIAKLGKTLAVLTVLAVVAVGVGLLVAWYMGNHEIVAPVAILRGPVPAPPAATAAAWTPDNPAPHSSSAIPRGMSDSAANGYDAAPDTRPTEQKLEEILLGPGDENAKSDSILALLTNSSPGAQVELSQHLINMTQDDHYDGVAQLLTNTTTPSAVSTVLMNDLLNRGNTLKLPMLLAIASEGDHPLAGQARDMLELFIQTDYGTNWNQWSDAVTNWLQQNSQ